MEHIIESLEKTRDSINYLASIKASKLYEYEKKIAVTMIKLQNGTINELEGEPMCKISVTNAKDIAKGICWKEKLDLDLAESNYKSAIVKLETMKSELNGFQSI